MSNLTGIESGRVHGIVLGRDESELPLAEVLRIRASELIEAGNDINLVAQLIGTWMARDLLTGGVSGRESAERVQRARFETLRDKLISLLEEEETRDVNQK